ncbi:MAG: PilW family protein [Pseudomonadota bacterium]
MTRQQPATTLSLPATAPRGFSLIELMLALGLGLVVVTGIVQLFIGNSQTYTVLNGQSRLQENARFGFEFITQAARSAGFFGCAPEDVNVVNGLNAPNWSVVPEFDVSAPVQGYDGRGGGNWQPALATLPRTTGGGANANVYIGGNGIDIGEVVDNTDVLVLRAMVQPVRRLTQVLQPTDDPVVEAPGGDNAFEVGDIIMIADCEQAAVVRVTGAAVAAGEATLAHAVGGAGLYENSATVDIPTQVGAPRTLSAVGRSFGPESLVGEVVSSFFYIAPGAAVNNRGDAINALWRKQGSAAPQELIAGIDDMQVLYGIDTTLADNVANANQYVAADAIPDPNQVVSLRVTLAVNSVDAVTEDGNQLTRTFTKTILLRNAQPGA